MSAINLNTVRSTIEQRLFDELNEAPIIPVVFNNMPFESITESTFVQSSISFGTGADFDSSASAHISIAFDSNVNKHLIVYKDANNSNKFTGIVATVSGTSISVGS